MMTEVFKIHAEAHEAFANFITETTCTALPITLANGTLEPLQLLQQKDSDASPQQTMNELSAILTPRNSLYLIIRWASSTVAITYVPYLAKAEEREFFLKNRHELVHQLGESNFSYSLICKEIGEITDVRSWIERDTTNTCKHDQEATPKVKDLGHRLNKCRLCDRRMQNPIAPEALDALKTLQDPGAVVQIAIDPTLTLTLTLSTNQPTPSMLPTLLPNTTPSFTFYTHPSTHLLYLISHSPDSAPVQQRMKHTLAIPGLLVHAEDVGVSVDRRIESHEVGDVCFDDAAGDGDGNEEGEGNTKRQGKYRSMYNRKGFVGTELVYGNIDADREVLEKAV